MGWGSDLDLDLDLDFDLNLGLDLGFDSVLKSDLTLGSSDEFDLDQ